MQGTVPKIGVFSVLPTPYRQPYLERLVALTDMEVHVLFMTKGEADRSWTINTDHPRMRFLPVKTRQINRSGKPLFFHFNKGVEALLAKEKFDLVIVPGWAQPTSIRALVWCRRNGVPAVVHSETHRLGIAPTAKDRLKRSVIRKLLGKVQGGLAVGSAAKKYLAGLGIAEDRIWFVSNTPDVEKIHEDSKRLRDERDAFFKKLDLATDHAALFVGRLIEAKAPLDLLEGYRKVVEQGASCGLVIVGDGDMEGPMRDFIKTHKLENVRLLGFQEGDDLMRAYAAADLFVLPSRQEPWGAVVNEAAAAGLPLLLTEIVGAGVDLVEIGENGYRVPTGDTDALAGKWLAILKENSDSDMSRKSLEIARRWGYDAAISQFRKCVETVLEIRR